MATSSLATSVPQFYPPTSGTHHRRSQRRRSLVSLPASAAFTRAAPCLRLKRSQRSSALLQHRLLSNAGLRNRPGSIPVSRLHSSWKDGISATGTESSCLSCFRSHGRVTAGLSNLRRFTPGAPRAFSDKSTFPLRSSFFGARLAGRDSHLTNASVGPDEPHAASPALSDPLLEKPGLNYMDQDQELEKAELERLLNYPLPSHPKLLRGELKNGLRYFILPNKNPADRFEAHMEVHVGSVDEEEDEQGIAHMIEHVTFLGSKKREKLLGTGARSNAYTDFHHTVFHIHSPTYSKESGEYLLPSVLDALNEIAFDPKFLPSRVEKERKAILSELQMMNTIEYRIDCQLLQHLHADNKLSQRFPIGLEEQIKKWDPDTIQRFHERWYYPANATLYLVGDIPSVSDAIHQIEAVFDKNPSSPPPSSLSPLQNPMAKLFANNFMGASLSKERENAAKSKALENSNAVKRERQAVRPPVEHEWSLPGLNRTPKPPQIFQHEMIPNFSLNMFAKVPITKGLTYRDLREMLMKRIFVSALHFRINTRYKSSNPRFTSIDLDHSDSGREGCAVTTLTITSEPKNWRDAIKVAVHEVRRLKEFGVTKGEMTRYMGALIKDSEQLASMIDNIPSVDNLDFIMESDALGHTVMDQRQGYECLIAVAETVTLDEVNTVGKQMLEFISDYDQPLAPPPTAIVACVPKKVHVDGVGETNFVITVEEITNAIKEGLQEPIYPEPELEVPTELISSEQLEQMKLEHKPSFVALNEKDNSTKLFDKETGIVQRRLANGISINYKITPFEKNVGVMRLIVCGGRANETADSKGSVIVGIRALSEGGCVGNFSREQVELFCVNNLINCSLECTEECIYIEFRFSLRDNGMRAAFQLLHMVLEHNMWLEDAFDRARQLYLSFYRTIPSSLERSTAHKLMKAMLNGDERFVEPTPESLQELTMESVKDAVMSHFVGDNMELSVAGDFTEEELESCILDYLGTVRATQNSNLKNLELIDPIVFRPSPSDYHFQQIRINDTDERACAYIAGPAPNRWGFTHDGKDLFHVIKDSSSNAEQSQLPDGNIRNHPLFFGVTLGLLGEIINSRLFTTVRDSLGLTYDVSFEVNLFDKLGLGWYVISVTSTPEKVQKAVDACKAVLRGLDHNKISQRELDRAKKTLLMKHNQDCKSNNVYWLALMAHLQAKSVPRKNVSCIRELSSLYERATIDDINLAYTHLGIDESSLFACIGISGANQPDVDIPVVEDEVEMEHNGTIPTGRGRSTMTRPTT